jgi:hypothetical protein
MMAWRTKMTVEPAKMAENDGLAGENDRRADNNGQK